MFLLLGSGFTEPFMNYGPPADEVQQDSFARDQNDQPHHEFYSEDKPRWHRKFSFSRRGSLFSSHSEERRGSLFSHSEERRGSLFSHPEERRGSLFSHPEERRGSLFSNHEEKKPSLFMHQMEIKEDIEYNNNNNIHTRDHNDRLRSQQIDRHDLFKDEHLKGKVYQDQVPKYRRASHADHSLNGPQYPRERKLSLPFRTWG